jgi:hypothetical protein
MTPDQINHARAVLAEMLPENGRSAPRSQMTRRKLSLAIGHDKDYIRDFIEGRKESLGAAEMVLIEAKLGLPTGYLLKVDTAAGSSLIDPMTDLVLKEMFEPLTLEERSEALREIAGLLSAGESEQPEPAVPAKGASKGR